MALFRRKKISPLDEELKKHPRRERKRLRELADQYLDGKVLKVHKKEEA